MTEQDLSTMLRSHVSDEPPFADGAADAAMGLGRRAVRRRRLAVVAGGVVACALAAVVAVPNLVSSESGTDRAIDPQIADALNAYDVTTMPRTMDAHARSVLDQSVPDLGPSDFVTFDSQYQRLPEKYWDKASGLSIRFDIEDAHHINVTLNHSRGEAEGDAEKFCENGLEGGYYVECTVETSDGGDVAISSLAATTMRVSRNKSLQGWQDQFLVVPQDTIESVPADDLWFTRTVKVIKSDTFVTYVSERVQAPDLDSASERLLVPPGDLKTIGLDPALVMPKPPPGDNGCPQWTMPPTQVSCSSAN